MAEVALALRPTSHATLSEVRGRGVLRLRSWNSDCGLDGRALHVAGLELPAKAGAVWSGPGAETGPVRVLCIAPGEWLLVAEADATAGLGRQVLSEAADLSLLGVDLSEALAILALQGLGGREVLSKGCGLDFHPSAFSPNQCARTRLAQVPVLIDCRPDPDRFELYVGRSYLSNLRAWLIDAGATCMEPRGH